MLSLKGHVLKCCRANCSGGEEHQQHDHQDAPSAVHRWRVCGRRRRENLQDHQPHRWHGEQIIVQLIIIEFDRRQDLNESELLTIDYLGLMIKCFETSDQQLIFTYNYYYHFKFKCILILLLFLS